MASELEIDVATLAGSREADPALRTLIDYAQGGFGIPLTLLLDGFMITGMTAPDPAFGAQLDARIEDLMHKSETWHRQNADGGDVPEPVARAFAAMRSYSFQRAEQDRLNTRRERIQEFDGAAPDGEEFDPVKLPGDLGSKWGREQGRGRFLTLLQASVLLPTGSREAVGTIRVAVDRVGAWWPAEVNFSQPGASDAGAGAG